MGKQSIFFASACVRRYAGEFYLLFAIRYLLISTFLKTPLSDFMEFLDCIDIDSFMFFYDGGNNGLVFCEAAVLCVKIYYRAHF